MVLAGTVTRGHSPSERAETLAEGSAQAVGARVLIGGKTKPHIVQEPPRVLERAADYGVGWKEIKTLHHRSCVT